MMNQSYSNYIVYVDESGDHSLTKVNKDYPIFVLSFCIFHKETYCNNIITKFKKMKFKYWGHDNIIFHENDIKRKRNAFAFLQAKNEKSSAFYKDLNSFMDTISMNIITVIIDKNKLNSDKISNMSPYDMSLLYGLERINKFLNKQNETQNSNVDIIFESRNKNQDQELENEFNNIIINQTSKTYPVREQLDKYQYKIHFVSKKTDSTGLQIADLIARPIGTHYLRPTQLNQAYDIIEKKIIEDNGLKIYPK